MTGLFSLLGDTQVESVVLVMCPHVTKFLSMVASVSGSQASALSYPCVPSLGSLLDREPGAALGSFSGHSYGGCCALTLCQVGKLFLEAYRLLLPVDTRSGPSVLGLALAFPSAYLTYLFKLRLQLEGKGRAQRPELQLPLPPSLPLSVFSFSKFLNVRGETCDFYFEEIPGHVVQGC